MSFTDRSDLHQAFERQTALLEDSLTVLEFYRIAAPAVAAVNCGHTELTLPTGICKRLYEQGQYLPLDIRVIRDSLFVYQDYTEAKGIAPGSTVLSINGTPAGAILHRLRSALHSDGGNVAKKDWIINHDFSGFFRMLIDSPAKFVVGYAAGENGDSAHVEVAAISRSEYRRMQELSGHWSDEELIETSLHEDEGYALFKLRFFDFYDDLDQLADPVDSFFATLAARHVGSLILDLRGNDGGDPYSAAYLLGYLLREPFRYFSPRSTFLHGDLKSLQPVHENRFRGDLYVLVDGGCCSTTGHFCSLLRSHGIGTFIGTYTGGSFACNGGYKEPTLRHTRIQLLLPNAVFIAAAEGLPSSYRIDPDHFVEAPIADLIGGTDPVLDVTESLIAQDR
jgi:hypothetical protein